jgi:rSAM/selenodomain-associated transferase 2
MFAQKLSIIIPVLNEAENLATMLEALQTPKNIEIIMVDGGSTDHTIDIAKRFEQQVDLHIVKTSAGRAQQMNAGAAIATGDIFLFLHGDCQLPPQFATLIQAALTTPNVIAGAFELRINAPDRGLRWIETAVNWRSRYLQMPYGDQAIFLRATTFQQLGGFPVQPIMEDFEFVQRLRKLGKIAIVPAPVLVSARRWQKLGIFKTTLINQAIVLAYRLGVPPSRLRQWYSGKCEN